MVRNSGNFGLKRMFKPTKFYQFMEGLGVDQSKG